MYLDENGHRYGDTVLRDFIRCFGLEKKFPGTIVYTVNICEDSVYDSTNLCDLEINFKRNNRRFIEKMELKQWKINELYIDHYRIPDAYLISNFTRDYFLNLKQLANSSICAI